MMVVLLLLFLLMAAAWKRLPVYDLFIQGARTGMRTAVQVLPNLAAMLCAVGLMQSSGLMSRLCALCAPAMEWLGLPREVAPLVLIRPMSGSASLAMLEQLMQQFGPDSRTGLIASTLTGAGEAIFYTVCVYMSGVSDRKTGYAIPCSLAGALAGTWLCARLF